MIERSWWTQTTTQHVRDEGRCSSPPGESVWNSGRVSIIAVVGLLGVRRFSGPATASAASGKSAAAAAAASSPPSKSADGAEEGAAGESRAGEARDGREAQGYLKEEVIVERVYGGGSGGLRK
jgi:hypothetical protein